MLAYLIGKQKDQVLIHNSLNLKISVINPNVKRHILVNKSL